MPAAKPLQKSAAMVYNNRPIWSHTSCPRPIHLAQPHAFFFPISPPIPGTHHNLAERIDWNLPSSKLGSLFLLRNYSHFIYMQTSTHTQMCIYTERYSHIWGLSWVFKWNLYWYHFTKGIFFCLWILCGETTKLTQLNLKLDSNIKITLFTVRTLKTMCYS